MMKSVLKVLGREWQKVAFGTVSIINGRGRMSESNGIKAQREGKGPSGWASIS